MANFGWIVAIVLSIAVSGVVGYNIGKSKKCDSFTEVLTKIFTNIENYVIVISIIVLVASLIYSGNNTDNTLLSVVLNIFATIIFSWLLTKKSTKADFKEKEEELALKSYRHINYIEIAADSASKTIEQYIGSNDSNIESDAKLILSSTKEQIKYIQGGIKTCKMDWYDLLSEQEKKKHNVNDVETENHSGYGTIQTVDASQQINQENA